MGEHNRLGVAVIGLGAAGRRHVAALRENDTADLIALADTSPAARAWAMAHEGLRTCLPHPRAVLAMEGVSLVVIATPVDTRAALAGQALEAGKDVLVEAPPASASADAALLVQRAGDAGRRLFVVQRERFMPLNRRVGELLRSGVIGDVRLGTVCYLEPPEAPPGAFLERRGVDVADALRSLLGDVAWVMATAWRSAAHAPGAAADSLAAQFGFGGRCVISVAAGPTAPDLPGSRPRGTARYDFHGERGSLHARSGESVIVCDANGTHAVPVGTPAGSPLMVQDAQVVRRLLAGDAAPGNGRDGLEALRVVEALEGSAGSGEKAWLDDL